MSKRASGVLLHPTSLAADFGIGDLGDMAFDFLHWLAMAGQSVWQILPLGPAGLGDSPYLALSSFAGNPLLISPQRLEHKGLLRNDDLEPQISSSPEKVDFDAARGIQGEPIPAQLAAIRQRRGDR